MRDIIASLPDQISAATRSSAKARFPVEEAQRIFLVGMGGSAIAGDVFAAWAADRSKVPIQVVRDYRLPSYARSEDGTSIFQRHDASPAKIIDRP